MLVKITDLIDSKSLFLILLNGSNAELVIDTILEKCDPNAFNSISNSFNG